MKLREIARLLGASHMMDDGLADAEPAGLSIDSRAISPGDLFAAIPGDRTDGHKFIREVFDKGASAAIVVHKRLPFASDLGDLAGKLIFVENTVCALQQMAARVLSGWSRPVVGVTGSAGKTTVKDLTAQVLGASGTVLKSLGNLNTGYGLPLTISRMVTGGAKPSDFDFAVLEMGMSSFGEIACLANIARPAAGIVSNVGTAHIEFFGSRQRIAAAKAELVDGIRSGGSAVLNADDPFVLEMRKRRDDIGVVTFGIENRADVVALELDSEGDLSGTRFILKTPDGEARAKLPLIGLHNVYNALAAAGAAYIFGLTVEKIAEQLAAAAPSKMRGELVRFANGVTVIDDSYNSNPTALIQSVRAMLDSKGFNRRIVVAGEMLELGDQGAEMHRQAGRAIAEMKVDRLFAVRGLAKEFLAGAEEGGLKDDRAKFFESPEEAAEMLIAEAAPGDLILVKGSRGVKTELVIERLRAAFGSPIA